MHLLGPMKIIGYTHSDVYTHRVQSINEVSNNRRSEMNEHLIRKSPRLRPQILPMPTRKKNNNNKNKL